MTEEAFIQKNQEYWRKLEHYNGLLSGKPVSSLSESQIREFGELFRTVSMNLSYANTHFQAGRTPAYLNQLAGIAHQHFYTRRKSSMASVGRYFTYGFAHRIKERRAYFFMALGMFLVGVLASAVMSLINTDYATLFLPENLTQAINSGNYQPGSGIDGMNLSLMSAAIMSNNIYVAVTAFAYGILAGVGTAYVLFFNGATIGALAALIYARGISMTLFFALILPHGFIELTAIFLSGACGLMIGKAILIPGKFKRKDALIKSAKEAAYLIPGIVVMLVVAGLIEGFFTPLSVPNVFKITFSFVTLALMLIYYRLASR
jgi:uncharacterized membrane protein SpoIIM required for sporulation